MSHNFQGKYLDLSWLIDFRIRIFISIASKLVIVSFKNNWIARLIELISFQWFKFRQEFAGESLTDLFVFFTYYLFLLLICQNFEGLRLPWGVICGIRAHRQVRS
jgi:hypothetical protein